MKSKLFLTLLIITLASCNSATTLAPPPTGTALPTFTPADTLPPVILGIQTRKLSGTTGAIIYADIQFRDPDGDAYLVAFEVVQPAITGVNIGNESISASPQDQIAGTSATLEWNCQTPDYTVALKAVILDHAGNRSNLFPFEIKC